MNIQELETKEIERLISELSAELESRVHLEKAKFLDEIRNKANSFGVSVEDLIAEASEPKKRKSGKIKPKYQNPESLVLRFMREKRQLTLLFVGKEISIKPKEGDIVAQELDLNLKQGSSGQVKQHVKNNSQWIHFLHYELSTK